jgi:hypothetical protein
LSAAVPANEPPMLEQLIDSIAHALRDNDALDLLRCDVDDRAAAA